MQRHQKRKTQRLRLLENCKLDRGASQQRRHPAVIGTRAGASRLTAAQPVRDVNLFVSRLSPDVDGEVLKAHLEEIVGSEKDIVCEALAQRFPDYRSFKVVIKGMPKDNIADLYKPDNWDKNILVKSWFN